jgi:ABC-type polysaccharide/polyol phosphate transport system ATPase subunit
MLRTMTTTTPAQRAASAAASAAPAIRVSGLRKTFRLPEDRYSTVKDHVVHPFRARGERTLDALHDVSLEVAKGEFVGVVGRNGSGKSTLLRCLCGIYESDAGELEVHGRVAPFIELGVGFNPDLAARDNAIINAVMLGLSPREARERFDAIIEFAELQDFVDVKLRNYSSGMSVRLAFAVTVQVDADVLLFDEVLAVGDASFQEKCVERFQRMKDEGRTVLLVTHDMSAVERFCDRAIMLEQGEVVADGEPSEITQLYAEVNARRAPRRKPGEAPAAEGTRIRAAWFEDDDGREVRTTPQGEPLRACVEVELGEALEDPVVHIALRDAAHRTVFATSSRWSHGPTGRFAAGEVAVARVRFENSLAPGFYRLSTSVERSAGGLLDARPAAAELDVHGPRRSGGVVDLPHEFTVERR